MKAVACSAYGGPDVLQVVDVPIPVIGPTEILIKNHAASITRADAMMRLGTPRFARLFLGLLRPKHPIIGTGYAGEVVQTGKKVTTHRVGDRVYGETTSHFAANAEYVKVDPASDVVQRIPDELTYAEAAPICDGILTSYNFLVEVGQLQPGQHVLINGAAGALGIAAVQIAKSLGATVTAVCSTRNHELVSQLGADHTVDYRQEDFTTHRGRYDLIYDTVGKSSFGRARQALTTTGQYISPVLRLPLLFSALRTTIYGRQQAKFAATGLMPQQKLHSFLQKIHQLFRKGELTTVLDKRYAIEEIVDAHRLLDSGHKRGNIVLTFGG